MCNFEIGDRTTIFCSSVHFGNLVEMPLRFAHVRQKAYTANLLPGRDDGKINQLPYVVVITISALTSET